MLTETDKTRLIRLDNYFNEKCDLGKKDDVGLFDSKKLDELRKIIERNADTYFVPSRGSKYQCVPDSLFDSLVRQELEEKLRDVKNLIFY